MSYLEHSDINVVRTSAYSEPECRVMILPDEIVGHAVFLDQWELEEFKNRFPHVFDGCQIVCYGGYYNAFELGPIH